MADPLTLPQRLRALAGEPWPFPVPDPDFGMTPNTMREAAARIEELEALLAGGFPKQTPPQLESQTTQSNLPASAGVASGWRDEGMNNLNERLEAAKDNAVLQAQIWAQEARTQRATALDILRYFGLPEHDWEALRLIQRAGIAGVAPPRGPSISQDEETVRAAIETAQLGANRDLEAYEALARLVTRAAGAPVAEWLLYEHDDGRHAVAPGVAALAFTAGEPGWHRVGPVTAYGVEDKS